MRGEVLKYDDYDGAGLISGDDGNRYPFRRSDLQQLTPVSPGMRVDFDPIDGKATDIYLIGDSGARMQAGQTQSAPRYGQAPAQSHTPYRDPYNLSHLKPGMVGYVDSIDENIGPGMWGYFTKCMRLYADGNGRAQRVEYWSFAFFYAVFLILALVGDMVWNAVFLGIEDFENGFIPLLTVVVWLGFFIPGITVTIRRLHDVGMSGWLYLVGFFPYLGGLFLFVVSLIPSQRHTNEHGPHPKAVPTNVF